MATSDDIIDRGATKAKAAVAQASDQFSDLKENAVRAAHTAADTVKSKLREGEEYVSEAADRVRVRGSDLLTDLQDHIEHNPLQAIAIAAGVGVVLGVLLRRR